MSHESILLKEATQSFTITRSDFKTWKVWKIQFETGKEAMLYKVGDEWMQRNEDELESYCITALGNYIDGISIEF